VVLCANETLIARFREGLQNGGYLRYTELVSQKQNTTALAAPQLSPAPVGSQVASSQQGVALPPQIAGEVKTTALNISGFQYLEW
jgi:hypothetical protein